MWNWPDQKSEGFCLIGKTRAEVNTFKCLQKPE